MTKAEHMARIMRRLKRSEDALSSLHDALADGAREFGGEFGADETVTAALAVPKTPKPD